MDIRKLRLDLANTVTEADRLAAQYRDGVIPPEVQDQIAGLLGQSDVLKAQIQLGGRLDDARTYATQPTSNPISWRQAAPGEGRPGPQGAHWRQRGRSTARGSAAARGPCALAPGG